MPLEAGPLAWPVPGQQVTVLPPKGSAAPGEQVVRAVVEAPSAAAAYDMGPLTILLRAQPSGVREGAVSFTGLQVKGDGLPASVRRAIQKLLSAKWAALAGGTPNWQERLRQLLDWVSESFVELLNSVPVAVTTYHAADEAGAAAGARYVLTEPGHRAERPERAGAAPPPGAASEVPTTAPTQQGAADEAPRKRLQLQPRSHQADADHKSRELAERERQRAAQERLSALEARLSEQHAEQEQQAQEEAQERAPRLKYPQVKGRGGKGNKPRPRDPTAGGKREETALCSVNLSATGDDSETSGACTAVAVRDQNGGEASDCQPNAHGRDLSSTPQSQESVNSEQQNRESSSSEATTTLSSTRYSDVAAHIQGELRYVQRRYGKQVHVLPFGDPDGAGKGVRLEITMTPSDPDWRRLHFGPQLTLDIVVPPGYPEDGVRVRVVAPPLSSRAGAAVHEGAAVEAALHASQARADALRCLLRFLDNHVGRLAAAAPPAPPTHPDALRAQPPTSATKRQTLEEWRILDDRPTIAAATTTTAVAAAAAAAAAATTAAAATAQPLAELLLSDRAKATQPRPDAVTSTAETGEGADAGADQRDRDTEAFVPSAELHPGLGSTGEVQLRVEGLQLDNVGVAEAGRLRAQCACARCGGAFDAEWDFVVGGGGGGGGGVARRGQCACGAAWEVTLRARLLHAGNCAVAAALVPTGCSPVDLLPSDFVAGCADCGATVTFRDVAPRPHPHDATCRRCFRHVAFGFSGARFARFAAGAPAPPRSAGRRGDVDAGSAGSGAGARGRVESAGKYGLEPGQPLPAAGTCRHYRHSHRWLRFPCCGRLFPCDACHELATMETSTSGKCTAGVWAARMVCGYCSHEQKYSAACVACKKKLAGGGGVAHGRSGTRFWEGGQGCRNKALLNRNDPHKYADSKNKTHCKKGERVGSEGKQKVQREQRLAEEKRVADSLAHRCG